MRRTPGQYAKILAFETLGRMLYECKHCKALHWKLERIKGRSVNDPEYSCCKKGAVVLPPLQPPPTDLKELMLGRGPETNHFRDNIRAYNTKFAMASMECKVDNRFRSGVFYFKISGTVHRRTGSLDAPPNEKPRYAQIYFVDEETAIQERTGNNLKRATVARLTTAMAAANPYVRIIKSVPSNAPEYRVIFNTDNNVDRRTHNAPTGAGVGQVAVILPDAGDSVEPTSQLVYEMQGGGLKFITNVNPLADPLCYPLLFPNGERGWELNIPYKDGMAPTARRGNPNTHRYPRRDSSEENSQEAADDPDAATGNTGHVTMLEFYRHRLQYRNGDGHYLQAGAKLYQQYMVDAWAKIESSRLHFHRSHQKELRADIYQDVIASDCDPTRTGIRVILPSSFTQGTRYMHCLFQDAMAICKHHGPPDLFITFTCNPKWEEITREIRHDLPPGYVVDLVNRVFKMKLDQLRHALYKDSVLGRVVARVHTIEFQKRGLRGGRRSQKCVFTGISADSLNKIDFLAPAHAHFLLIFAEEDKIRDPEDIDRMVCAELPDPDVEPELFKIVSETLMHGPCGKDNPESSCMKRGKGECAWEYPKDFKEETEFADGGYARYRRRNNGRKALCKYCGVERWLDNRSVVPYNRALCLLLKAHINVEVVKSINAVKYIYKYVYKGAPLLLEIEGLLHFWV